MDSLSLNTTPEKFVISIDKDSIDRQVLFDWLELLHMEQLAHKVDFGEEIVELGEEIKSSWWEQNKSRFIEEEWG